MEIVSYVAAWLVTIALLLLARRVRQRKLNLPPGPKPWPVIGNLNLIGPLPHRSVHELSKKYGPIMQLQFGWYPVVVGSTVELAKSILKTHDVNFGGRPKLNAGKYTAYNFSDIVWSEYGPYWRQARKIFSVELFSTNRLESYEYIRKEEMKEFLFGLYTLKGSPVALKDKLADLSLNVISRMVLGKKYTVKGEEEEEEEIVTPEEFKKMVNELFFLNGTLTVGDSIPWLNFLDLGGQIKKMKALSNKLDRFLEQVLDQHINARVDDEDYVGRDMMDVLIQYSQDPNLEVKLERHGVKAFTQDLIAGGTESSAVIVEWMICELLKKPDIFEKATEELDRVIGHDRWVQESDIPNLPFIGAICKETMRLHPVAPFLVPRECREDCKIDGYDIVKGTRVFVSVWSIGRDPTIWDNPEEFNPERFVGRDIDVKGQDFELLPFGSGRRMCPGYSLGLKVIQSSLANLLHGFTWKLPGDMGPKDLDMEEIFAFSSPKKISLIVVGEPRLPSYLYST